MRRLAPAVGVVLVLGSLGLLVLLVVPVRTVAPTPEGGSAAEDRRDAPVVSPAARRLLERAAAAPTSTAYTGTQVVSAWSSGATVSRLMEVEHTPDHGTTWRVSGTTPTSQAVVHAAAQPAAPSILAVGAVGLMARHYSLAAAGTARVAGRDADVVEARRPGGGVVVARFWLDRETGLVLRREVYDGHGRATRASAFVDVEVDPTAPRGADGVQGKAWPRTLDVAAVHRMRTKGWDCPDALPGPLPLVDARRGGDHGEITHLSYADGIASISVFQQRGELDHDNLDGYRRDAIGGETVWVRDEVPLRVVWSDGDIVYTVVADAPQRTVDRAVRSLHEGAPAGAGDPVDRLGRGLDRVASWFNPFE